MASATPVSLTILAFCTQLVWKTFSATLKRNVNPLFFAIFPDLDTVTSLLASISLQFAPGLLDVLQRATPPTLADFKSLPDSDRLQTWGVYLFVLEKDGHRPKIYVGSSTNSKTGLHSRMLNYDNGCGMPWLLRQALDEGFEITHRGLLCWMPMPPLIEQSLSILLMLALECAFTWAFWAMVGQTEYGYGMSELCLWDRTSLTYTGLCSHSALSEGSHARANFGITEEQAAVVREQIRQRKNAWSRDTYAKRKAKDPGYLPKRAADNRRTRAAVRKRDLNSNKHYCHDCDESFSTAYHLKRHLGSRTHKDKVNGVSRVRRCDECGLVFARPSHGVTHFRNVHKTSAPWEANQGQQGEEDEPGSAHPDEHVG
ncbi:hypothetical protein KC315_g10582 [Hortaea werneckii]|nr:hypothetical protein KC315_g10582 [Hortaea werneckii]